MRFREPPSSWYDPPDEPSDVEEEACHDAWVEYLEVEYCERCEWTCDDDDNVRCASPCDECAADANARPQAYADWCSDWHDEQRRRWVDDV